MNDPAAETGTQNQALSEEIQAKLKEILAWLQKDAKTKSEMSIISKECLSPSAKNSLKTSKLHCSPSLV
jgi:hypothetical protein